MGNGTATSAGLTGLSSPVPYRTFAALVRAGFRRFSTYRQATVAGIFTNTIFGFLNCYVLLAAARSNGGSAAGYQSTQLAAYVWITQGLLATVGIWGDTQLADRIRSGEVIADLLRPVSPVVIYLAGDIGRAGFALLTRALVPTLVGALAFDLYRPHRPATYPLFAVSVLLAVLVSFGGRYLVNCAAYWLLDSRGPQVAWNLSATLLGGMYFPLRFLPHPVFLTLWLATPFPSLMQAPLDIGVERVGPATQVGIIGVQVVWLAVLLWLCRAVQRAAERRMVMQGG